MFRKFTTTMILVLVAGVFWVSLIGAQENPESQMPERVVLTLCDDPATTVGVAWRTEDPSENPSVQYSLTMQGPGTAAFRSRSVTSSSRYLCYEGVATTVSAQRFEPVWAGEDRTVHYYSAKLIDLKPDTSYVYRVGGNGMWSEWNQLHTASVQPGPFRFVYMGDVQNNILSTWSHVARRAHAHVPDAAFWLFAGDLVNDGERDDDWEQFFTASDPIFRTVPLLAAPGNHEYYRIGKDGLYVLSQFWTPQFVFPENGPPGLKERVWYLDYRDARIISLDSQYHAWEYQAEWLKHVLDDARERWTIVTFHHPVYSSGRKRDNPELRAAWRPVLEQYGADLVLTGHDHTYARTARLVGGQKAVDGQAGVVYVNSVSGPKMYRFGTTYESFFNRTAEQTQLYQVIEVDGNSLGFKAFLANGTLYDAFKLHKTPDGGVSFTQHIPSVAERRVR